MSGSTHRLNPRRRRAKFHERIPVRHERTQPRPMAMSSPPAYGCAGRRGLARAAWSRHGHGRQGEGGWHDGARPLPAARALPPACSTSAMATAVLGALRQPARHARRVPAWRAGQRLQRRARRLFDPSATASSCSTSAAAGVARRAPHRREHDLAPGRRHRAAARQLGVDRWLVFGGSWGSTLALAYAQALRSASGRWSCAGSSRWRRELLWYYQQGASLLFPDDGSVSWPRSPRRAGRLDRRLPPPPDRPRPAGRSRRRGPGAGGRAPPSPCCPTEATPSVRRRAFALAFSRIENHYSSTPAGWRSGSCCATRPAAGNPLLIVQGRYDMATPAATAWDLHRAWPEAEFHLIHDAGHAFSEPGILAALIAATDRYADVDARCGGPAAAGRWMTDGLCCNAAKETQADERDARRREPAQPEHRDPAPRGAPRKVPNICRSPCAGRRTWPRRRAFWIRSACSATALDPWQAWLRLVDPFGLWRLPTAMLTGPRPPR